MLGVHPPDWDNCVTVGVDIIKAHQDPYIGISFSCQFSPSIKLRKRRCYQCKNLECYPRILTFTKEKHLLNSNCLLGMVAHTCNFCLRYWGRRIETQGQLGSTWVRPHLKRKEKNFLRHPHMHLHETTVVFNILV